MCEALCQVLSIQYLSQYLQVFKLNTFITSKIQLRKLKHFKLGFLVRAIVRIESKFISYSLVQVHKHHIILFLRLLL